MAAKAEVYLSFRHITWQPDNHYGYIVRKSDPNDKRRCILITSEGYVENYNSQERTGALPLTFHDTVSMHVIHRLQILLVLPFHIMHVMNDDVLASTIFQHNSGDITDVV